MEEENKNIGVEEVSANKETSDKPEKWDAHLNDGNKESHPEKKHDPKHHFSSSKEITIKVNPKKLGKWIGIIAIIIIVLLAVFYLGRLSAGVSSCGASAIAGFFGSSKSNDTAAIKEDTIIKEDETSNETSLNAGDNSVTESVTTNITEDNETATEVSGETEKIVETATEDEPVITSYTKVDLSLDGVYIDWKDTWGKITGINYTINNKESGTIKPSHFIMLVEGYPDAEKKFNVGYSSVNIEAGVEKVDSAAVSDGFSYSEVSAGDLESVEITLTLYDANDKVITAISQEMDLSGE